MAPAQSRDESRLLPLSWDRVTASLDRQDDLYTRHADDSVSGEWEFGTVHFLVRGDDREILCVHGTGRVELTEADYLFAQELCNAWNSDRWWPKAYVLRDAGGHVLLRAEYSVDYGAGVTDAQLDVHIDTALLGCEQFFAQVADAFPSLWKQVDPKN